MESAPHRSSQPTQPTRRRICEEAEAQVVQQRLGLASKTENAPGDDLGRDVGAATLTKRRQQRRCSWDGTRMDREN